MNIQTQTKSYSFFLPQYPLPSLGVTKMVFQESQTILRGQYWLKSLTFEEIYGFKFFNFWKDFLVVNQTI